MKCPDCHKRMKFLYIIKSEKTGFKRRVNFCDDCARTCCPVTPKIKITATNKEETGILRFKSNIHKSLIK